VGGAGVGGPVEVGLQGPSRCAGLRSALLAAAGLRRCCGVVGPAAPPRCRHAAARWSAGGCGCRRRSCSPPAGSWQSRPCPRPPAQARPSALGCRLQLQAAGGPVLRATPLFLSFFLLGCRVVCALRRARAQAQAAPRHAVCAGPIRKPLSPGPTAAAKKKAAPTPDPDPKTPSPQRQRTRRGCAPHAPVARHYVAAISGSLRRRCWSGRRAGARE
jgi:hypothetical protein